MVGIAPAGNFRSGIATLYGKIASLRSNQNGTSALEFSFFTGILIFGVLNVVDISVYLYQRMQVENATQMAVQAAWKACDPSKGYLPATTSCPELTQQHDASSSKHLFGQPSYNTKCVDLRRFTAA
jgi:Flp pilus assembly protein TadG